MDCTVMTTTYEFIVLCLELVMGLQIMYFFNSATR